MAKSFSFYRVWQTSNNNLLGSARYHGNHCVSFKISSVTPKRLLKTQIFEKEKTNFPPKKLFRPIFFRIVEYEKAQLTIYRALQRYCASYKVEFLGPTIWMKTISQKRPFSRRKTNLAIFFSFHRLSQTSNNKISGSTRFYGNHCASYKIICVTSKRLLKTKLFEKGKTFFPPKKLFRRSISRIVEFEKAQ